LKTQMCAQLRLVLAARHRLLEREAARIAVDLSLASSRLEALSRQAAEKEQLHRQLQEEVFRLEKELATARRRLADLEVSLERTRGQLQAHGNQVAGIEHRLQEGAAEGTRLGQREQELARELAEQRDALAAFGRQEASLREQLEASSRERAEVERKLAERERAIESSRQAMLRLMGEAATLRNQLAQAEEHLAAIERDAARAARDEQAALQELEWSGQSERETAEKIAARRVELAALDERRRQLEDALETARRESAELRHEHERLRAELSKLRARRDSLEEILSHRAYTTEAVKRLFSAVERGQAGDFRPLGVLADFLEVDPAWEKAVEEFLHEELEYVLVDSWDQAERGLDLVRSLGDGQATFLVVPGDSEGAAPVGAADAGEGARRLRDVLRASNGVGERILGALHRLNNCRLVEDAEAARRLALAHPHLYLLLPDGACYHGRALSGGRKSGGGPLALKRELRELRHCLSAGEREMAAVSARLEELARRIAALEQELDNARAVRHDVDKQIVALEHERRKVGEELSRARSRLEVARIERERLAREKTEIAVRRERTLQAIAEAEGALRQHESRLGEQRREFELLRAAAARAADEHASLRAALAGIEERRRSQAAAVSRLEAEYRSVVERRKQLATELEQLGREKARLAECGRALAEQCEALQKEMAGVSALVRQLEETENARREELVALGEELRALHGEVQVAQQTRAGIEVELVRRQADLRFLDETSRKELGVPAAELAAGEQTLPGEEELAEAEQRCRELRERIEALGPVNPQALEEFQQTEQRYNFLNAQRQDLLDSIRDTEQAIREIDAETRKRFQEAFTAINRNFGEMFQRLFHGGSAEMRLTDPENLAESGIEIVASPPGKRLQNVLLLSGGEKALTALALLLAIFKYQPSPFCVLDEVDAPLDDPNIDRLMRILREMSAHTQFIIITHTKRTMEAAEALYGVTMQEPGVSKLVSVRLQAPQAPPPEPVMEMAARA
ncbi:MAG: chromosome segregation protein SMC, partial [Bryobacterales bacterium]|nr:chromosome segregation protein SMC [Bryobacteraceae bacterium]MDW8131556.1 chromosome segregation protein SMC [Bryobacterales bacterium]